MGLDKSENDKLEVTFRVSKPVQGQAGGGKGSTDLKSSTMISLEADTIPDAVTEAYSSLSRKIFLAQIQLIVISEELARQENIRDLLDFLERNRESNIQARVLIARGIKPKEIMASQSELEYLSIYHLINVFKQSEDVSFMRDVALFDIFRKNVAEGDEAYISIVQLFQGREGQSSQPDSAEEHEKQLPKMEDLSIGGIAVFNQGIMVGSFDTVQTRAVLLVDENEQRGMISLANPLAPDKFVNVKMIGSQSTKSVKIVNNTNDPSEDLLLSVKIKAEGIINYQQGTGDLTTPDMIKLIEGQIAEHLRYEIQSVIAITQKDFKTDIFEFGRIVHKHHLNYWRNIEDWNALYSELPVDIEVQFKLKGSGYVSKPMELR